MTVDLHTLFKKKNSESNVNRKAYKISKTFIARLSEPGQKHILYKLSKQLSVFSLILF